MSFYFYILYFLILRINLQLECYTMWQFVTQWLWYKSFFQFNRTWIYKYLGQTKLYGSIIYHISNRKLKLFLEKFENIFKFLNLKNMHLK